MTAASPPTEMPMLAPTVTSRASTSIGARIVSSSRSAT